MFGEEKKPKGFLARKVVKFLLIQVTLGASEMSAHERKAKHVGSPASWGNFTVRKDESPFSFWPIERVEHLGLSNSHNLLPGF